MKRKVITLFITLFIGLAFCLAALSAQTAIDPNLPSDPNAIKLPEGAKMPVKLRCPVHGIIGKDIIAIEVDGKTKIYCAQCVKSFVSEVLDLNLPKLEIVK